MQALTGDPLDVLAGYRPQARRAGVLSPQQAAACADDQMKLVARNAPWTTDT